MLSIATLWYSTDESEWEKALRRYADVVRPDHAHLDTSLARLDIRRVASFDALEWYEFLRNVYFRWKYTEPHRYVTTTKHLARYARECRLWELDEIRGKILTLNRDDISSSLGEVCRVHGLGAAGASGLLAIMYPGEFGTIDQFVVLGA